MKTVVEFARMRREGRTITMVTSYDYWSARWIAQSPIDAILVGDSAAMVMHGLDSTVGATVEMMALHVAAVRRGAPNLVVVADLPFLSTRKGLQPAMEAVEALMRAGAQGVKLEGADGHLDLVRHLADAGIPVMGHLGLTPQMIHALGGYRVQGRSEAAAQKIREDARALEAAGCFAVVLECIPEELAGSLTETLAIPTIGIGSGRRTSGQILVLHDLLGLNPDFQPSFARKYLEGGALLREALERYDAEMRGAAPQPEPEVAAR